MGDNFMLKRGIQIHVHVNRFIKHCIEVNSISFDHMVSLRPENEGEAKREKGKSIGTMLSSSAGRSRSNSSTPIHQAIA